MVINDWCSINGIINLNKITSQLELIPGWLKPETGRALLYLSAYGVGTRDEGILEVGSYLGKSAAYLAAGSIISARKGVTTLDVFPSKKDWFLGKDGFYHLPETGYSISKKVFKGRSELVYDKGGYPSVLEFFLDNIKRIGLEKYITPFKGTSEDFVKMIELGTRYRMMFIDGDHSYFGVKKDIVMLSKFLIPGGVICFHDYTRKRSGVFKAVNELIVSSKTFLDFFRVGNTFIAKKACGG